MLYIIAKQLWQLQNGYQQNNKCDAFAAIESNEETKQKKNRTIACGWFY